MSSVFLVYEGDAEAASVIAVYSTRERAAAHADAANQVQGGRIDVQGNVHVPLSCFWAEHMIDTPLPPDAPEGAWWAVLDVTQGQSRPLPRVGTIDFGFSHGELPEQAVTVDCYPYSGAFLSSVTLTGWGATRDAAVAEVRALHDRVLEALEEEEEP